MPLLADSGLNLVVMHDWLHPESGITVTRADSELICCQSFFCIALLEAMAVARVCTSSWLCMCGS